MHWLMIAFVVSLGALLLAAAGVAHHIWHERARTRRLHAAHSAESGEEPDLESEP